MYIAVGVISLRDVHIGKDKLKHTATEKRSRI